MIKLRKTVAGSLVIVSALALNPLIANAEWKNDNIGWWNTEGNTWSIGWRLIDGNWYYFGEDGYMETGWLQFSDGEWYYLNSDGSMAHDTVIDGYTINSDGTWSQSVQKNDSQQSNTSQNSSQQSTTAQNNSEQSTIAENVISNVNPDSTTISGVTGVKFDDITKIVFYDERGVNKPVTVEDKDKIKEFMGYLDGYVIEKSKNQEKTTGWIHSAQFYVNDKVVMNIAFVNPININEDDFNIKKGNLDTKTIGEFLKSIDSSYDIMAGLN